MRNALVISYLLVAVAAGNADEVTGPTDDSLPCAQLIPRALQRQYLPNMTIAPMSDGTDIATMCRIEGGGVHPAANIRVWCSPEEANGLQPDTPATPPSWKTVGRAAVLVDAGELQQLTAWDIDSSCQISLAVPKTVDAIALGRHILASLPWRPIVSSR